MKPVATHRHHSVLGTAIAAAALGVAMACASTTPPVLEKARDAYGQAASDAVLTAKAPVPLYEAKKSLDRAEHAWEEGDEREASHQALLAQTRVEIARAIAEGEKARERSRELANEREKVLLQARTAEVGDARAIAKRQTERARDQEAIAERQTERARDLEASLRELEAKPTDRGMVLTLGDVLFDFDKATLRPGAEVTLDRLARFLRENPDREILIEGHTDNIGSPAYNRDLSRRRAESVTRHLEQRGVEPSRVVTRGYGQELPRVGNDTEAGRQQNRRVEVVILEPGDSALQAARRRGSPPPAVGAGPNEGD